MSYSVRMDFQAVRLYLQHGRYRRRTTNNQKRAIRRSAANHYKLESGCLYYRAVRKIVGVESGKEETEKGRWRKVVESEDKKTALLQEMHDKAGHLGASKTLIKVEQRFYWHNMAADIRKYVSSCHQCQVANKKFKISPGPLHPVVVEKCKPWYQIGIDFAHMPKSYQGNQYYIAAICYFTKHASVKALPNNKAENVAIFLTDLMMVFGYPSIIVSDQGREFCNTLVDTISNITGCSRRVTSPYHPQANGLIERYNQTIKSMISKSCKDPKEWDMYLGSCNFAYNTSVQASTKMTPHFLMFGNEATLPNEEVRDLQQIDEDEIDPLPRIELIKFLNCKARPTAMASIEEAQAEQKKTYDGKRCNEEYQIGCKVLKLNMRRADRKGGNDADRYIGPYIVVGKGKHASSYRLKTQDGKTLKTAVSAKFLKNYNERARSTGTDVSSSLHDDGNAGDNGQ